MIDYTVCKQDHCILNHSYIKSLKKDYLSNDFKPEMPTTWNDNRYQWLSTIDIMSVMKQYEDLHTDFLFIGPVPIDFDHELGFGMCISNELCRINLKNLLNKQKKKLGVIFNLDEHYKSGSHWVALFSDFTKGGIYYFDSYGYPPKKEIKTLMDKIRHQGNQLLIEHYIDINNLDNEHDNIILIDEFLNDKTILIKNKQLINDLSKNDLIFLKKNKKDILDINNYNIIDNIVDNQVTLTKKITDFDRVYLHDKCYKCFYNQNRFQFKNSECGVYSMHFIEEFLNGKNFQEITNNIFSDEKINKKRQFYYRPSDKS